MHGHGRLGFSLALFSALSATMVFGQSAAFQLNGDAAVATPLQDDANLHDVQFVGQKIGWAAGDRGTVWKTDDGGAKWEFVKTPVDCSLRSVCFLTNRVGWIVGGGTTPYTKLGFGVVLFTNDGGRTWEQPSNASLPRLHYVKFFDLTRGVAVGDATSEFPTGLLTTEDGGITWRSLPGARQAGWRTACFLTPEVGAVAGRQGQASLVGGGRLLQPRLRNPGLRSFHDVEIRNDDSGWMVGDGGLVLRTENGGVVWQEPAATLPEGVADLFDFRTVECRKQQAWIAGEPGSVIWHTADGGKTWLKQHTGQPQPINALRFVSETTGFAVGDLGLLMKTVDGGETWQAIRGGNRRVAMLSLPSRPSRVSTNLLTYFGGELGYRSLVLMPVRRDVGPNGSHATDLDSQLSDGVTAAGGSAAEYDWRFPIVLPGLERNLDKLVADWNRRTEGRLGQIFLGKLVGRIRTWRPNVIVIDRVAKDDATSRLLNDALLRAVEQAANPTRFVAQQQLAGLKPWRVSKVYQRLPAGSTGDENIDPHRYLPRLGTTVQVASAAGYSMFHALPLQTAQRESYRLIVDSNWPEQRQRLNRGFFTGISLPPGSPARRMLLPIDEREYDRREKLAQRQRNFQAIAERSLDDERHAAQLIAQLRNITAGMSDAQAALQLAQLAHEYQKRARWDLTEATLVELVERYPDEPVSHLAMRRLLRLWSAVEPAWQRARKVQVSKTRFTLDVDAMRGRIQKAQYLAKKASTQRTLDENSLGPDPVQLVSASGELKIGADKDWRQGAVRNWLDQSTRMASLLRIKSPALYATPEVQFSLASLMRQRGTQRLADRFYGRFNASEKGDAWNRTAAAEFWLLQPVGLPPKTMAVCKRAGRRPILDGLLSDDCWQNANEYRLTQSADDDLNDDAYAFVMLSYDDEYLYFAASIPRDPDAPDVKPIMAGRTHDADLRDYDRIGLFLDVDRDYATYYALEIDQRSRTHDACWDDASWNPKWFVAVEADKLRWRIEAAIPFEELTPVRPVKNTVWALGLLRTVPAVRLESWTHPAAARPRPETFGLLRFD
jgi:photosystem II stability/assembly factor-like uncharacterized protein